MPVSDRWRPQFSARSGTDVACSSCGVIPSDLPWCGQRFVQAAWLTALPRGRRYL